MSPIHNIKLVQTVMDQLMSGNPEPLLCSLAEDAFIKAVLPAGTPISGDFRGREGFLRYFAALNEVMEILEVQTHDYVGSADHVIILGYERARVRVTGQLLECDIATVVGLSQGKINKIVAFADMSAIVAAYPLG